MPDSQRSTAFREGLQSSSNSKPPTETMLYINLTQILGRTTSCGLKQLFHLGVSRQGCFRRPKKSSFEGGFVPKASPWMQTLNPPQSSLFWLSIVAKLNWQNGSWMFACVRECACVGTSFFATLMLSTAHRVILCVSLLWNSSHTMPAVAKQL